LLERNGDIEVRANRWGIFLGEGVDMLSLKEKTVCILGSGYADLPLANAFAIENKSVKWVMDEA
jgi:hypothetical protein